MSRGPRRAALAAAVVVGWTAACARQGSPPGGPEDRRPPVVVATTPEPFAVLEDLDASIRFQFDERISERIGGGGSPTDAVLISPRVGEIRVKHGRRSITVEPVEGFRPDVVYRVTLQPVVSDMFSNQLTDPFELVFSTGGEAVATTLAGEIWDRITGRGAPELTVHAVGEDSLVHHAKTSREGIYAFRYLPPGSFTLRAFDDQNRNGELDSTEVQGGRSALIASGDTLFLDIAVLAPDTLPANLMSAEAVDSVTVALLFDDYLDPDQPAEEMSAALTLDERTAPGVLRLYQEADYAAHVQMVTDSFARLDSLDREHAAARAALETPPDTTGAQLPADADSLVVGLPVTPADTAVAEPDSVPVLDSRVGAEPAVEDTLVGVPVPAADSLLGPPAIEVVPARPVPTRLSALPGARPGPDESTGRVLPGRRVVVILDTPLEPDVEYTVRLSGATNINGLPDGGGETTLLMPSPPLDTTFVDTLPPSATVPPDTGSVAQRPTSTVSGAAPVVGMQPAGPRHRGDGMSWPSRTDAPRREDPLRR